MIIVNIIIGAFAIWAFFVLVGLFFAMISSVFGVIFDLVNHTEKALLKVLPLKRGLKP